jgi:hypothetical protein
LLPSSHIPKSLISSDATVIVGDKGSVTIRRQSPANHLSREFRSLYPAVQDYFRNRFPELYKGAPSQPSPQIVIGYQDRIYIGNYDKDPELEIGVVAQGDARGAGAGFQIYDVMAGGAVDVYGDVNFNLQIPEIGLF